MGILEFLWGDKQDRIKAVRSEKNRTIRIIKRLYRMPWASDEAKYLALDALVPPKYFPPPSGARRRYVKADVEEAIRRYEGGA